MDSLHGRDLARAIRPPCRVGRLRVPLEWKRHSIETSSGPKRVIVAAPDRDEVVCEETLVELRSGAPTRLHHELLPRWIAQHGDEADAVILRGRGAEGSGQFRLSKALDDAELAEVGYLLARAQLQAWRPLLQDGVLAIARVELRVWELAALRSGTARLRAELTASKSDPEGVWLLEHSMLNFGVGLGTALSELLPERLDAVETARGTPDAAEPAASSAARLQ